MNAFSIKLLAAFLMVIDHIGFFFFPEHQLLRVIGRISFPLFAFLIVNGFKYTHDVKKYFLRLFIFANIIQIPSLFMHIPVNVIYTLSFGLLCIILIESDKSPIFRIIGIGVIISITYLLEPDYSVYGVLLIVLIHLFEEKYLMLFFASAALSIMFYGLYDIQIFAALAVIPMYFYNGLVGRKIKYFFYIFYPGHLILLEGINNLIK